MKYEIIIIFDMFKYYLKRILNLNLNFYDLHLQEILDEYNYILEYKKDWKKRNEN